MQAKKVSILERRLGRPLVDLVAQREAGVSVGLESRPPKLGALITSLDEALS